MVQDQKQPQPRILVLDDDEEMLQLFTELIEDAGWMARAIQLKSQDQVVSLTRDEAPQVLILDLVVHREHVGWEAIRDIQSADFPTPPIIVCTASEVGEIPEDVRATVKALLPKPFDLDALYGAIHLALTGGEYTDVNEEPTNAGIQP